MHIITNKIEFIRFNKDIEPGKKVMELADGSRQTENVFGKGDVSEMLHDINKNPKEIDMKDALYISSYKFHKFSVPAATRKGVCVHIEPTHEELVTQDGSECNVERQGNFYFMNNVGNAQVKSTRTAEKWYKVLGHCNIKYMINA